MTRIPHRIPSPIFWPIIEGIKEDANENDLQLITTWYKEDRNALPHGEYVLQNIEAIMGNNILRFVQCYSTYWILNAHS